MRKIIVVGLLVGGVCASAAPGEINCIAELPNGTKYFSDKIVVGFKDRVPDLEGFQGSNRIALIGISSIDNLIREHNVVSVEPFYDHPIRNPELARVVSRIYIFRIGDLRDFMRIIADLRNDPNIEYAELYTIPEPCYTPNDPLFFEQWHLPHVQAPEAWDIIRGDTTRHSIIAIIDTGVKWDNPDITPNIWVNEPEDLNGNYILDAGDLNGIDDDGNGYIDDVIGWDHGSNDNNPIEDQLYHGTPVASCASPATDNGIGIAGMGFSARIMCTKAANHSGIFVAPYQSIIYAADNGALVINCSWATQQYSQTEQNIINAVYGMGSLVVASAAATTDTIPAYPCGYENVMAVTATDEQDHKAYFADYGSWVDVCAPGVNMRVIINDTYAYMTGTSFSAALVSGLAGLVWANFPGFTNQEIEEIIENGCDSIDHLNPYYAGMLGAGRINAYNCVAMTAIEEKLQTPDKFITLKAYPNPFNASCKITVSDPSFKQVEIYDLTGRLVERLELNRGEAVWDASSQTSGVYFARVNVKDYSENIKIVLLK